MFHESMIAPCGLDCALCKRVLTYEPPCPGCLGPSENKPDFCREICPIPRCEKRAKLADGYCDTCEAYPCPEIMEKEIRYANAYPVVESPIGNLADIRAGGMERFLKREAERWSCPACGKVICVHTGVCAGCGKSYTVRRMG